MRFPLAALAVTLPLLSAPLHAAPAKTAPAKTAPAPIASKPDARAVALLDRAVQAYAAQTELSQNFTVSAQFRGKTYAGQGSWSFQRPARARVQWKIEDDALLWVCDGTTIKTFFSDQPKTYQTQKVQPSVPHDALIEAAQSVPTAAGLPLSLMMGGINPVAPQLGVNWQSVTLAPRVGLDGVKLVSPLEPGEPRQQILVYLDPKSHLIARVESQVVFLPPPGAPAGSKPLQQSSTLVFSPRTQPLSPATFQWTAPAGAKEEAHFDPRLAPGTSPFALSEKTLDGKTIALDAYKGRVVLLDFWATWCEPCREELPNVKANYAKYHARGFDIVGVSLDEDKKELRDFIKAQKMPWPQLFDGKVFEGATPSAYGVAGIPFTLLIGKDGKIIQVNPRGWRLSLALQRALGG